MSARMTADLCLNALDMAVMRQKPRASVIFHSDQGSQYASKVFRARLTELKMLQSMSRRGNCWDNAVAESLFNLLKTELVYQTKFATRSDARIAIFQWIEAFYNRQRLHSALGYKTPLAFEEEFMLNAA